MLALIITTFLLSVMVTEVTRDIINFYDVKAS